MKIITSIIFALLMVSTGFCQTADDYFHGGAQSFINADLQTAINQVQNGLTKYPNNPKLNALMEKLQEEKEKQQQQQQQNQQEQQNQDQQEQQEQEQNQNQEQEQEQQQEQEEQQQSDGQNQKEQNPEEMNPEELQSQQISKEDAEKILQALAQKEKELLKEFKKKKTDGSAKHEKDW